MKLLALDVGNRRIGVAVGDETIGVALARDFIANDARVFETLTQLVTTERISKILVGTPLGFSGAATAQTGIVELFVEKLTTCVDVPIEQLDERLSTLEAHANLREADIKTKHHRALVDSEAARILLQTYFDRLS